MPSKKKSGNGFWTFALSLKNKPEYQNLSNQQLQELSGKLWSEMSLDDRQAFKAGARLDRDVKYTSEGVPVDEILREEQAELSRVTEMKKEINLNFQAANEAGNLANELFLLIHVNHLVHHSSPDRYYICELSVVPFSLQTGVFIHDVFHEVVKPGRLPLGLYGPARLHSDETHRMIDSVLDDPRVNNTREVFLKLTAFMKKYIDVGKLPILYAPNKTLKLTRKVIQGFCEDFKFDEPIKVYNLEYMFFALKNTAADRSVWVTDTFSYSEIDRDVYAYTSNICCKFHELADLCYHCSRSIAIRYVYTICSNCCRDFNIALIPGLHVPLKDQGDAGWSCTGTSTNMKTSTIRSTDTASQTSTRREFDRYTPIDEMEESETESVRSIRRALRRF